MTRNDPLAGEPGAARRAGASASTLVLLLAGLLAAGQAPAGGRQPLELLKAAAAAVCEGPESAEDNVALAMGGGILLNTEPLMARGLRIGERALFMLKDGARVSVERFAPGERLRRLSLVYYAGERERRRAEWMIMTDPGCRPLRGWRLIYDGPGGPLAIERTDASLEQMEVREPLNPPVPEGYPPAPGVPIALVDSGVNYLLESIRRVLARDAGGEILGYDYWDEDERPFDTHPARSPFFPQRHGTQTAGVIIAEAPVARLVPYRYPRPDMRRMKALVEDAAANGVVIVNLSLGSDDRESWTAFAEAARRHPDMLFIASAGNDGRDIDGESVYPAALKLGNLITATSASENGLPAEGSNWGADSVDVLVPAEALVTLDFYGRPRLVSGSSYAAARVTALAACLLAANPNWRAPELKAAILSRVKPSVNDIMRFVGKGYLDDPTRTQRGACPPEPDGVTILSETRLGKDTLYAGAGYPAGVDLTLSASLVVLEDTAWSLPLIESMAGEAAQIFAQCGVALSELNLYRVRAPRRLHYFSDRHAVRLVQSLEIPRPAVYFVRDTLQRIAFDAEAIGRSGGRNQPALIDTAWMTEAVGHSAIALAHELFHVLADSGSHSDDPANLMYPETLGSNTRLNDGQCMRLKRIGTAFGNLRPIP